jgi:prevent-host-death family protein
LKAHAAEIIRDLGESRRTLIITQKGEAKAVLQDVHAYEELQESLAMLKLLAQSQRSVEKGRVKPFREAFRRVRQRLRPPAPTSSWIAWSAGVPAWSSPSGRTASSAR